MKFFSYGKDGGEKSTVWGLYIVEIKWLFSIVLLRFENGTRDAFHSHAFNAISWVLRGELIEQRRIPTGAALRFYRPSFRVVFTGRDDFHQVKSVGRTWVLSLRGPWTKTWREYLPNQNRHTTLTHGRREVPNG